MAQLIEPPGGEGPVNEPEWWVVDRLRRELPDDYLLIPNLLVAQAGGQRFEYDLVVVAPHAVYVVEVKGWQGRIRGDRFEWSLNSRRRRNPMLVTERKAKVLKSLLVNHAQALGRVWVEAVVVLAAEQVTLELTGEAARMVVKLPELAGLLQDPGAVGQQPEAIAGLGRKVCEAILHRTGPRERTMRFREYEVLETLEQGEEESLYRARRVDLPGAPEVRLRVVTLSPYLLGEERRRERMARLRREVEALWRMGAHPNVVAAREVFEDEDGRMVVVLDPDDSRSLRQRLADGTPLTVEQRLGILADVCRGLAHAHEHGVVHRLVTPAHVLLGPDGQARLADFELAKLVSEGTATVWQLDAVDLPDRSYLAPELRNPALGQAGPATDLYGLGRLAWELFDSGTAGGAEPTPATPPPTAMPAGLAELVRGLLQAHPAGRPADASEMLATIERLRGSGEERRVTPPKPEYEVGDLINNDFEVREILGSGGFRFVYRVYRAVDDCEFALKVYNAGGFEEARREVTILRSIGPHPNIEEIVWADRTSQGQWYLLTKLVEGEPLGEYARGGKRLSVDEVRRVGDQLLAALEAIHPDQRRIAELETAGRGRTLTQAEYDELRDLKARGIVHRDVKPHNLMRAADGVVLIDFNIASLAGAPAATQSGTPRYQAPDATGFPEWNPSVDLFAAGVTLYELLCGEHPYEGAVPTAALRPRDPRIFRPELSGELAAFLLKACAPHADQRYASATDMRDAWAAIESFVVPTDRQRRSGIAPRLTDLLDAAPPNVNPMVTELLGLCSQARRSNRETRGLSDLAESTYVETRLDRDLADAVLAGRHRLVIVTGNAGDGKTAFIQKTESRAKQLGATVEQEGPTDGLCGWPTTGGCCVPSTTAARTSRVRHSGPATRC